MYRLAEFNPCEAQDYENDDLELMRGAHSLFQFKGFQQLSKGMIGQDSGQPWFLYWLTNGIEICNFNQIKLSKKLKDDCISYLKQCHNPVEGGFSGAPGL